MSRRAQISIFVALVLLPFLATHTAHAFHASRVNCSYVKQLGTNLSALAAVVKNTPHLAPRQAKQQTDAVRLREMSLELGNTRQVVPKSLDKSIINAVSAVQRAATSHARHKSSDYRRYLGQAEKEMNTAWKLYRQFRSAQHCA